MSITLGTLASMSIGGTVIESDANAALSYMEVSFPGAVRLFFGFGTTTAQVFAPGAQLPKVIVTLSLHDGTWTGNNGTSGTLLTAGLTSLQTALLGLRNGLELFATANNVVVGTDVAWTSGMF